LLYFLAPIELADLQALHTSPHTWTHQFEFWTPCSRSMHVGAYPHTDSLTHTAHTVTWFKLLSPAPLRLSSILYRSPMRSNISFKLSFLWLHSNLHICFWGGMARGLDQSATVSLRWPTGIWLWCLSSKELPAYLYNHACSPKPQPLPTNRTSNQVPQHLYMHTRYQVLLPQVFWINIFFQFVHVFSNQMPMLFSFGESEPQSLYSCLCMCVRACLRVFICLCKRKRYTPWSKHNNAEFICTFTLRKE
jgi:hypothetical protein